MKTILLICVVTLSVISLSTCRTVKKHCKIIRQNNINICRIGKSKAVVLPQFNVKLLNGNVRYDYYWKINIRTITIDIDTPSNWKEIVGNLSDYEYVTVTPAMVTHIKFINEDFDWLKKNEFIKIQTPCFNYKKDKWMSVDVNNGSLSVNLKLYETGVDKSCFYTLSDLELTDGVKIVYKIDELENEFDGHLNVKEGNISIQRRVDGNVSFARNWNEYVNGFGDSDGSFWIGLEMIHQLTKNGKYKIMFEMKMFEDNTLWYATYNTFKVGSATDYYRLTIGEFNRGESNFNAEKNGYGMVWNNNMQFSTMDQDHDTWSDSCSTRFGSNGGWWFRNCAEVYGNGLWKDRRESGSNKYIHWGPLVNYDSLTYFHMMLIRK